MQLVYFYPKTNARTDTSKYVRTQSTTLPSENKNKRWKTVYLVIFNQQGIPVAIIECKAPHIPLDQKVFDQVAVYCRQMGVATFFLTNGMEHYACRIDTTAQRYKFLSELPDYVEL